MFTIQCRFSLISLFHTFSPQPFLHLGALSIIVFGLHMFKVVHAPSHSCQPLPWIINEERELERSSNASVEAAGRGPQTHCTVGIVGFF